MALKCLVYIIVILLLVATLVHSYYYSNIIPEGDNKEKMKVQCLSRHSGT